MKEKALEAEAARMKKQARTARVRARHSKTEEKRNEGKERRDPVKEFIDGICCEEKPAQNKPYKKRKTTERPKNYNNNR